jgi:dipeptidyl aminopeptidase/acylaminoacyl peptidase
MTDPIIAPYGSWKSPITSDLIVAATIGLTTVLLDGDDTYWIESRPTERGRTVLVRWTASGPVDVTPAPFNVRTRVHEYGGGACVVDHGEVFFSNFTDQRVYHLPAGSGETPQPITPESEARLRYADFIVDRARNRLLCVREEHGADEHDVTNTIVELSIRGGESQGRVLVSGNDFYSSPRLSPDGTRLAWLTWNHPNMPWDGTELWVGEFAADGTIAHAQRVTGGETESIFQPEWSPDGILHFVSDLTGWWNLYRLTAGVAEPLHPMEAEFGEPQWVFGMSTYAFDSAERIVCAYTQAGLWHFAALDTATREFTPLDLPYTDFAGIRAMRGKAVFLAGSPTEPWSVVELDLADNERRVLKSASSAAPEPGYLSEPQPVEFPTEGGLTAFGLFYPPKNRDYAAPPGERPPLLVLSHGGPTGATGTVLSLGLQFWTSRGFAVLDVNYGGSTGYGRAYRERLNDAWGIVDVDDCVNGARYLAERGDVDGARMAIKGGSAGGYTTLCALTFRDVFKAGASYFGVADLGALARDTHKFESRYLDHIVGPYPARKDIYDARSPVNFTDRLTCPVIFFQGLDDKVVPPNQAEMMFEAMRAKGLPTAYLPFEGEGHGFRRAENIKRSLDAELYFYSRVFGFEPAEPVEPVQIENL